MSQNSPRSRRARILSLALAAVVGAAGAIVFVLPRLEAAWHWRRAQQALRHEDFELARARLHLAQRERAANPAYAFAAAQAARRDGDYRAARTLLTSAETLGQPADDVRVEGLLLAVQQFGWRGRDDSLVALIADRPEHAARIREGLAYAFFDDSLLAQAIEHAAAWAELEPWSGLAWQLVGQIKEMMRDLAGALDAYGRAVECNPRLVRAQVGYADALLRQLQPDAAVTHYRAALAIEPRHRDGRVGLARACLQLDRMSEASEVGAGLLAEFPNDAEVVGLAGRVALLDGRIPEAEALLTRSAAKVKNLVVLQDLQRALARRGKPVEARATEEQVARLREDFRRLDQLSEEAQSTLAPLPRVEMGRILIRNGLEREGVAWLHDALRCAPGYPPAHAALAEYYTARGQTDRAEEHRRSAGRR